MSTNNPTLADLTSRLTQDGKVDPAIIEILNESNAMLEDATWKEATGVTENVTTVRSGLPNVAWRRLNYGVQPSKSKTKQISDSIGMLEAYAECDAKLVELNGNTAAFRLSEDRAFIESMNQTLQNAVIYGNIKDNPAGIMGFAPRFSTTSKTKAENAMNVLDAGGTGTNLGSIWLVGWGLNSTYLTYPKGLPAGLKTTDLGEVTLDDADGGHYQGYRTHYEWNVGLVLRDWRYVVRIANIDRDALRNDPDKEEAKSLAAGARLWDLMTEAVTLLPNMSGIRPVFYCDRTMLAFMRKQARNAKNVNLTLDQVAGRPVTAFDGIPVRRVDALGASETRVI